MAKHASSPIDDPILVTGAAGFVGFHVTQRLLADGRRVIGVDNFTPYYDVRLKHARWGQLEDRKGFLGVQMDLANKDQLLALCDDHAPGGFIHLAAQPGVRYGMENPGAYVDSNLVGFMNVLEAARAHEIAHLVFASTSSVYGANRAMPYAEHQSTAHPLSLYAATKRANELLAHSYAHLFRIPCTGLRFFTVYGPWGRPDMAPQKFAARIFAGDQIEVYNGGNLTRDFTFVEDIVEGVVRVLDHVPVADEGWDPMAPTPDASGVAPFRIFNIGRGAPVNLMDFIATLEKHIGRKANMVMLDMQPGDVEGTWCDVSALERAVGYRPRVSLDEGLAKTVKWFRAFYKV
ncbi:MAG: NAD-dependent epimerase/dehydratase family protein [Rhodospirillaceae bacterium]|nr:MAG: NAD-dependent epimerase/dehydratase family protein [Rhodospirillaceae bacterium]